MKLPTAGAVPFFTERRTRSSLEKPFSVSISSTRSTKRSVRSRASRVSTKPFIATENIGLASTPCATRAVFSVAIAKPAASAASIIASGKIGCRRARNARTHNTAAATVTTDATGSRSAAK